MMNNRLALSSLLVAIVGLTACSDSPMSPTQSPLSSKVRAPSRTGPGLTLLANASAGLPSVITVCSANASATFSVSTFSNNNGTAQVPPLVGAGPYTLSVAAGACATIWRKTDFTNFPVDPTTTVTVTQTGQQAGFAFQMVEAEGNNQDGNPAFPTTVNQGAKSATLHANAYHGATTTFTQQVVQTGCTYTKGWYQNKNGAPTIVLTIDGRTPDQQRAIFAATPGKPGGVTWTGGNNTLNLYQQLLAALNNLDGDPLGGPASVDAAIANALAATNGSGLNITLVGSPNVGALTTALSDFNEGKLAGFPHCD